MDEFHYGSLCACVCVSLNKTWIMLRVWPVPRWVAECTQPVCLSTVTSVCVDGGAVVNGTNGRRHAEPVFQPSPDERQASREKHEYFYFFGVKRWSYGAAVRRFLGWPKSVFGVFGIFGISTWQ